MESNGPHRSKPYRIALSQIFRIAVLIQWLDNWRFLLSWLLGSIFLTVIVSVYNQPLSRIIGLVLLQSLVWTIIGTFVDFIRLNRFHRIERSIAFDENRLAIRDTDLAVKGFQWKWIERGMMTEDLYCFSATLHQRAGFVRHSPTIFIIPKDAFDDLTWGKFEALVPQKAWRGKAKRQMAQAKS